MQFLAHIIIDDEKILVLARQTKTTRWIKIRKSGKDGTCLSDESIHLKENSALLEALKRGEIVYC